MKLVYLRLISPPSFVTQYLKLLLSIKIIVVRSWMLVDMFGFNVQKERGRHVEKLEHDFEDRHYQTAIDFDCSYCGDFDFDIYDLTFLLWENCCKKLDIQKKKKKKKLCSNVKDRIRTHFQQISSNFIFNGQRWAHKVMGCSCFNIESPIRL